MDFLVAKREKQKQAESERYKREFRAKHEVNKFNVPTFEANNFKNLTLPM